MAQRCEARLSASSSCSISRRAPAAAAPKAPLRAPAAPSGGRRLLRPSTRWQGAPAAAGSSGPAAGSAQQPPQQQTPLAFQQPPPPPPPPPAFQQAPPPPPPPPAFQQAPPPPPATPQFAQPPPGKTSHTAALYSSGSEPIRSFGFASGFGDKYDLAEQLGSGTFGIVHVAVHKETGERFAVKSMPKRFAGDGTLEAYYVRRVLNEVDICNHLGRSLNVCYLYEVFEDDTCVDLVMELCSGGQLWDKVKLGSYSEKDAQRLVREMARAVAQCHGMDVMLRDIKPENFMFLDKAPDSPLKAIDFGISVFCKPGQYIDVRAGTPIYIAPEVLRMNYTLSADIWSLGIVAYQLLTGRLPFSGEDGQEVSDEYMAKQQYNNKDVFRAVLKAELDFASPPWDMLSAAARDFVQSCLNRDEKKRPTAEQLLQHPWLQEEAEISDAPFADTIVQRLQRYGLYGRFRQVALKALMQSIAEQDGESSQQFRDMRRVFEQMDRNSDGRVTYSELKAALQSGHFQLSPSEVEQLAEQLDSQHSGTIDWSEWVAAMADWRSFQGTRDWDVLIGRAFAAMDPNGDGVISAEELEQLLCGEDGCEFPDTVEAALREADRDHDGVVSMQDFKEFIESKTDDSLSLFEARVSREGSGSDSSGSSGSSDSG